MTIRSTPLVALLALVPPTLVMPGSGEGVAIEGTVEITTINGDALENRSGVVVFLEGGPGTQSAGDTQHRAIVLQEGAVFDPGVVSVIKGTTIDFPNDDRIFHNIFSLSAARPFDLGVYPAGESRSVQFSTTGLVKIFCNMHPDMVASIVVLDNALFTTTDSLGNYTIPDVPPGTYTLRTWHEFGGESRRELRVAGSGARVPVIKIQEDRMAVPHLNKFGRRYGGKYGG